MSPAYDDDLDRQRVYLRRPMRVSSASTQYGPSPAPRAATTNQQSEPLWLRPSIGKLLTLLDLEPGWDGRGSVAPGLAVAQNVLAILSGISKPTPPPPAIAPVADGRIQLAWYAAGVELEITVDERGRTDIDLFDVVTGTDEAEVMLSDRRLDEAIARLSAP